MKGHIHSDAQFIEMYDVDRMREIIDEAVSLYGRVAAAGSGERFRTAQRLIAEAIETLVSIRDEVARRSVPDVARENVDRQGAPARGTWVFRNGKLIPKSEANKEKYAHLQSVRSELSAPAIRRDGIDEFVSHIDGKTVFDSKSAWERHVRANGMEIIGNEPPSAGVGKRYVETLDHSKSVQKDVIEAYHMVENGYVPPPLPDIRDVGVSSDDLAASNYVRSEASVD